MMADVLFACMTYETGVFNFEDFPQTEEPVWILGKKYSTLYGGIGPTTDTGWGCMLRCGQMALAQALINHHLGREWTWKRDVINPTYVKILQMFQDKSSCIYSIHQIAQMGILEGRAVGQWFGPNTIAQVLKKLSVYDDWTSLVIYVAMDNAVIIDDIRKLCRRPTSSQQMNKPCNNLSSTSMRNRGGINSKINQEKGIYFQHPTLGSRLSNEQVQSSCANSSSLWRPLLLFIPLRLGLTEINHMYIRGLKTTFKLRQSVGIIGGRPNHALYFIGIVGDELVFLDPHTTQPTTVLNADFPDDDSYHCCYASRMNFTELNPSIALCFYFRNEADFDLWCNHVYKFLIVNEKIPLFELSKERPPHWPTLESEEAAAYKVLEEKKIVYTVHNGFQ
ncbi:cysteine protease ATG4B-like isoform X3 [Tachypleus tridentatus]|uniref:cysteine protease ATG4B-like isoform X3 n=1 Tax=Tachypleus tridentatus TaxID=6853 RepID=UPI003FD3870E